MLYRIWNEGLDEASGTSPRHITFEHILHFFNCRVTRSIAQGNTDQTTNFLIARPLS